MNMIKFILVAVLVWLPMFALAVESDLVKIIRYERAPAAALGSVWVSADGGLIQIRHGKKIYCQDRYTGIDIKGSRALNFYDRAEKLRPFKK